jgi:predicted DNA-binding protein (MmcQ/YjbR family)
MRRPKASSSSSAVVAAAPAPTSAHPVRALAASDVRLVERLRKICLALPEANERISHGEPTWFAGKGKSFAMVDNHHHGAAHLSVWLPQPSEIQESLIDADPARFFRPPYVGPRGWVGVVLDTKPEWAMVERLVHEAYRHVATRTLVARMAEE